MEEFEIVVEMTAFVDENTISYCEMGIIVVRGSGSVIMFNMRAICDRMIICI